MSHTVMITTPALKTMEGHGLTDAALIVDGRRTAVAYSVFCPATDRYSLVTLDGRWAIPGKAGYKTRGPATVYARKNVTELRPEGMRVLEPARHDAEVTRRAYGRAERVRCMGTLQHATRGQGYECGSCRVSLWDVSAIGFTLVSDGRRGTHTLAWALDRTHGVEFGTVPSACRVRTVIMPGESVADSVGEDAARCMPDVETEAAVRAVETEARVIAAEMDSVKGLAAEAEAHAEVADAAKTSALESRNVAEAHAAAEAARDAVKSLRCLVSLAVARCEALSKMLRSLHGATEAVTAPGYAERADRAYEAAKGDVDSAWEYTGAVENAEIDARSDAAAAEAEYGRRCAQCGRFFRQPTRSGEPHVVLCACSPMFPGSAADVPDPADVPAPWECDGQATFDDAAMVADAVANTVAGAESAAAAGREAWTDVVSRGGHAEDAEAACADAEHAYAMAQNAAETEPTGDAPQCEPVDVPAGEVCPRCDRPALYGTKCAECDHVIITGLIRGPRPCPAQERAEALGKPYCPKCLELDVPLYRSGAGDMCSECARTILGRRVADLEPVAAVEGTGLDVPSPEIGTCTSSAGDDARVPPDVVSDPGIMDAWEGEGGAMLSGSHAGPAPVGRPGPYRGRLVTKAEAAARARAKGDALRPETEARAFVARERAAWLTDMRDLAREARNWGIAGVAPETAQAWYNHAHEVAKVAANAADTAAAKVERYEWEAQRYEDDAERCAREVARARAALARMTAGDVPAGRGVWLSADGGAAVSFVMPSDEQYAPGAEGDRLFVATLADAVAARDEGRTLTSKDVPSKQKTGHGPGTDFKSAVVRAGQPLMKPWKAPRIPSQGKPLPEDALPGFADAGNVVAETEAAPGVWLPMAAVRVADTASANGWTVAMERREGGSVVIVRVAGVIERKGRDGETATAAGECVAVFEDGQYVQARSGALMGFRYVCGATLSQVLKTVGQTAEPGQLAPLTVTPDSAPAPAGVSDPGGADAWDTDGGACTGADQSGTPDTERGAAPVGTGPSPEMGTCTAPAVDAAPVHPDVVSAPGAVGTWDGEGGAMPGTGTLGVRTAAERDDNDPYAVRPAVPEWAPVPGTNRRTTELTCAGVQYRVLHAPDAVLPYTVRRTLGGADVDLGGWVGLGDVRAIVMADRRRTAALEADRRRIEQQQRRAAYRLQGERRQAPVRLTEEARRAIARRAEEKHRPVAAELYVSPITGNAALAFVCGTCAATHDDPLWRPQIIGGSYHLPLSVDWDTIAALVEKRGWTVTGTWTAHGTRGDTMRARIAPTPAYLAWVDATYGPAPATPEVEPGECITSVQRGWWDVVSKEGHRYELTWRPTLTGPVWSARHRSADGFETVATTGLAATVLTGMRIHSAECGSQPAGTRRPESHVPIAS